MTQVAAEETATATNETTLSTTEENTETDALAAAPAIDLTADCAILNYVDEEVFEAGNHVLRLAEEETLSSYVFLNADGTKTVYYLDEAVKFVDSDGAIQEKNLTLALSGTAYTTTRNDISLSIPNDPASGITLIWKGHAVRIIPQGGTLSDTVLDGNSIRYTDYYGEGADLVYTPTLAGVKEDIVLESYTGQNTFTFMLNTGGLNLYSVNGRYYLAEYKTATDRIELGNLVTFDANGRFSVGTMTSQTISAGNIYRLTLTVDEAFLSDPETVYPVSIDPTINIKDSNDDTAGSIEDVNIYEGRPNLNANWTYMHVGYYDDTYQTGRILVRLTGFINDDRYDDLSPSQITSATFHLKEATGKAAATINLYAAAGSMTWTESGATWNNCGVTQNTLIDSVEHGRSVEAEYDITNLVRAWVSTATSPLRGFMLCHAEEDTATKGFYSSEYSTTGYRPYATITYTEPEAEAEVYLSSSNATILETGNYTLTATTSPSGQSVTWSSSNTAVATVDSSGKVTAQKAGTATITAALSNGATDSCVIYVILRDGIYTIKSSNGYYMGLVDNPNGLPQLGLYSKATSGILQIMQFWRVNRLADGNYSIRPVYKLNCGIHCVMDSALLGAIGLTDTQSAVPSAYKWKIEFNSGGYYIKNALETSTALRPNSGAIMSGMSIISADYSTSSLFQWNFEYMQFPIENERLVNLHISFDYGAVSSFGTASYISTVLLDSTYLSVSFEYAEQCGIYLVCTQSNITPYSSDADRCANNLISENCPCSDCTLLWNDNPTQNNSSVGFAKPSHCKSITRLRNNLLIGIPDNTIRISFTGHAACYYSSENGHGYGVGGLSDYTYPIICIKNSPMNGAYSISTFAHEIAHLYGLGHHEVYEDDNCIMEYSNRAWFDASAGSFFCGSCIQKLQSNQNKHWPS